MILINNNVKFYINSRPDVNEIKVLMKESIDYILNNILSEEEKEELKKFTRPIMVQLPPLPEETEEERQFLNGVVEEIVNNPNIDTPIEMEQVIEEAVDLAVQNMEENEKGTIPIEVIKEQLSEKIEKKVEEKVKQEIKKEEIKEKIEEQIKEQIKEQIERKVERTKKSKSPILLYSIIAIIIFIIITLYFIFKK